MPRRLLIPDLDAPRRELIPLDLNLPRMDGREGLAFSTPVPLDAFAGLEPRINAFRLAKVTVPHQRDSG
jgi:hypothetical protein